MLPIERQHRIKERIQQENTLKISDLSEELQVSEMTIHRDLKPLLKEGFIRKTFGGISLASTSTTPQHDRCVYCSRSVHEKIAYRLILPNNKVEVACCSHCGLLRHRQLQDDVMQAICYDFLRQTTISAQRAYFVMDTTVDLSCCQPQVLTFEWEDHAHRFVKGFGGHVYNFQKAMDIVFNQMEGSCHSAVKRT